MWNPLWTSLAVSLHVLEVARCGVTVAADPQDYRSSPSAMLLTVRAEIISSLGRAEVDPGQDVALSCLVTFPQMFALYEPYMMRWYRRNVKPTASADAAAAADRAAAARGPHILSNGISEAEANRAVIADVLSSNERALADSGKYKVCYRRPHGFGFLLNYTLIIRGFAGSDEGEYVCEGVDNPDDPLWTLNARVSTERLTLSANEKLQKWQSPESLVTDLRKTGNVSSCTAAGFAYQIHSTNCIYYSEKNIKNGFTALVPCPIGTTFDLAKCRCIEGAACKVKKPEHLK